MRTDLAGILVVSLEHALAAPFATCKLADAGARVIKFERRQGDFARNYDKLVHDQSAYFVWVNRGKQSAFIDIKQQSDVAFLMGVLSKADVFIQNLAPGAAERAGLGSAALRRRYPRLITCNITGYGPRGPYRDMKAYDLLVQAETGLASVSGIRDQPCRVGISVCDIACGMSAYQAILEALYARASTGEGRELEISLFQSLAEWMNVPYLQYRYGGYEPIPIGLAHPTIAPYGAYVCKCGSKIMIGIQNEREWQRFASAFLDNPELARDERFNHNAARVAHRGELDKIIVPAFLSRTRDELAQVLQDAKIAFGDVSTLHDLIHHPQLNTIHVGTQAGMIEMIAPPGVNSDTAEQYGTVPTLGEHDAAIRKEFAAAGVESN
jgi:crotonobetainyl-CoA:carnitine CoA-transferase CaiB-like acyl-CoA transferase